MPYTTIYLQYREYRSSDVPEDGLDDFDDDELEDDDDIGPDEGRTFVEFTPVRLSATEPRGKSAELQLDFDANVGDKLHIVVVRYNSGAEGVVDDWCVEQVFQDEEEAEDLVERIEDSLTAGECVEAIDRNAVITRAEAFCFQLGD
jgi:hypothetical protein